MSSNVIWISGVPEDERRVSGAIAHLEGAADAVLRRRIQSRDANLFLEAIENPNSPYRKHEVISDGMQTMQRLSEAGTGSPKAPSRRTSISGLHRVNLAEQVQARIGRASTSGSPLPPLKGNHQGDSEDEDDQPRSSPSTARHSIQSLTTLELIQRQSLASARHNLARHSLAEVEEGDPPGPREGGGRVKYSLRRDLSRDEIQTDRSSLPATRSLLRVSTLGPDASSRDRTSISGAPSHSPGSPLTNLDAQKALAENRRGVLHAARPSRASLMGGER